MSFDVQNLAHAEPCPKTGLFVQRRPEWTNVECGQGFEVTFIVLGGQILLSLSQGWQAAGAEAIAKMFEVRRATLDAFIGREAPFVELRDYSLFRGRTHREARDQFISEMRVDRERILGYIGFNAPFAVKVAMKVGATLYGAPFPLYFSKNYEEAVAEAVRLLRERGFVVEPSERRESTLAVKGSSKPPTGRDGGMSSTELERSVDELLRYIGRINWDIEGTSQVTPMVSPDHPLATVFEALDLIKMDLDEQLRERERAEEERKRLERRLQQVQRVEALGTLAGGIAHDFKNLIQPILLNTELMLADVEPGTEDERNLQHVLASVKQAAVLSKRLLRIAKQDGGGEKRRLHAPEVLRGALELVRPSLPKSVALVEEIDEDVAEIEGDSTSLMQVVVNLVTNAMQAMGADGGRLGLSLKEVELSIGELSALQPGRYLRLTVEDEGGGIPRDLVERIFDPYFTTKPHGEGTGLGLSVAQSTVVRHGGEIAVQSVEGEGTTFIVYLPILETSAVEHELIDEAESASRSIPRGHGERVLLVEDEAASVQMSMSLLERLGYEVVSARDGAEAIQVFGQRVEDFDVVLTDQRMPQMNGVELAKALRERGEGLPIVLCTGFDLAAIRELAEGIEIQAFLKKPLTVSTVASTLRSVLDGGTPSLRGEQSGVNDSESLKVP